MSIVTYDTAARVGVTAPAAKPTAKREGRFARIMARVIAARQRQAMEEVRRYGILPERGRDTADRK